MDNKTLKFSLNPSLVDKIPPSDKRALGDGFVAVDDTIDALAAAISEEGWAFSYQFEGEKRQAARFLATDILAVDVDGGLRINDALSLPIVENHCSLFYPTVSHTPEEHRFRLVFVLPRTITKADELVAAARSLARRVGGDPAATDAARLFYGNKGADVLRLGGQITDELLGELIEDGKITPVSDTITNASATAARSYHRFRRDLRVQTRSKEWIPASSITETVSIHCPFHADRSPSALISKTQRGSTYIHCKSCQTTWWMEGTQVNRYDFYSFEDAIRAVKADVIQQRIEASSQQFAGLIGFEDVHVQGVRVSNAPFLDLPKLEPGITLIKSPKGSGKTSYLSEELIKLIPRFATLEDYENATDFETEIPIIGSEKVLLIGHRQALIGDLCNRLKLNCYLDDFRFKPGAISERQRRYGICLDSLGKLEITEYDIVVIDEVEQVLAHFMSETLADKREDLFHRLCVVLERAKKIVALDADLGWVTFTTLTTLARIGAPFRKNHEKKPRSIHIYLNEHKVSDLIIHNYKSREHITQVIVDHIISGKRVFITSNSKEKVKILEQTMSEKAKDAEIKLDMIAITSENSRQEYIKKFIENIKEEILNYQVILTSPSLGTGIDITFENGIQEIDTVFGIFESRVNSHFDIDQQLARVRNPKEVHVWVNPQQFNFETELEVVQRDVLKDRLWDVMDSGELSAVTQEQIGEEKPFFAMAAMITAQQRASKNDLRRNFLDYKVRQGWTVKEVQTDDSLAQEGRELLAIGKRLKTKLDNERTVSAKPMNEYEFLLFKRRQDSHDATINPEEWYSYFKTRIELFYGEPISAALVQRDDRGRYASQIRMHEELLRQAEARTGEGILHEPIDFEQNRKNALFKNRGAAASLLYRLLSATPFFKQGKFDQSVTFTSADLVDFIDESKHLNLWVQTHLDIPLRADLEDKPALQLNAVLRTIGLRHALSRTSIPSKNKKIYHYKLCLDSLRRAEDIIARRKDPNKSGWAFINKLHNFTYLQQEIDEIANY